MAGADDPAGNDQRPFAAADGGTDGASFFDAGLLPNLSGVWVGQVAHAITALESFENFKNSKPEMPPEHVVLVLSESGGVVTGSILFGTAPPLPTATDPDAFYPPLAPQNNYFLQDIQLNYVTNCPFNGQPYTVTGAQRTGTRITFNFDHRELWSDWCKLQTHTYLTHEISLGQPVDRYVCAPESPLEMGEVDKKVLCFNNICTCDEKSCHVDITHYPGGSVDLVLRGESLEGIVNGFGGGEDSSIWQNGLKLRRVK